MDFKEIIKRHLDDMAQQDFAFAERYKLESKSLDSCCKYIMSEAKKKAKGGCAAIEDAVVFGWAVHYYQEDSVVIEKTNVKKVTTSKIPPMGDKTKWKKTTMYDVNVEVPKEVKPIKALVKDKKENKCVQLDLFEF